MDRGYVKLWRRTMDSRVFHNEGLLKVWVWCLMKASRQKRWVTIKTGRAVIEVEILPGQFIFGRDSAAKELKMKPSSIRNRIKKLENMQNLDIKADRQYSIISIRNWDIYQCNRKNEDSKEDEQRTGKGQAKDTDKNVENVENTDIRHFSDEKRPPTPYQDMVAIYHEELPELPHVRKLTDKRKTQARKIFNDPEINRSLDQWRRYCEHIRGSKFLMGRLSGKNWQADFEWITNYNNYVKIIEGKYHR